MYLLAAAHCVRPTTRSHAPLPPAWQGAKPGCRRGCSPSARSADFSGSGSCYPRPGPAHVGRPGARQASPARRGVHAPRRPHRWLVCRTRPLGAWGSPRRRLPSPPPGPPAPGLVPRRRPRLGAPSLPCWPQRGGDERGGCGRGHRGAKGHPRGGPWRQWPWTGGAGDVVETHGPRCQDHRVAVALRGRVRACRAAGLGIRATARGGAVAPTPGVPWGVEAAEPLQASSASWLGHRHRQPWHRADVGDRWPPGGWDRSAASGWLLEAPGAAPRPRAETCTAVAAPARPALGARGASVPAAAPRRGATPRGVWPPDPGAAGPVGGWPAAPYRLGRAPAPHPPAARRGSGAAGEAAGPRRRQQPAAVAGCPASHPCVGPHARWRWALGELGPSPGVGSATWWRSRTPARAAGVSNHVWTLPEGRLVRGPPGPPPWAGEGASAAAPREARQDTGAGQQGKRGEGGPASSLGGLLTGSLTPRQPRGGGPETFTALMRYATATALAGVWARGCTVPRAMVAREASRHLYRRVLPIKHGALPQGVTLLWHKSC